MRPSPEKLSALDNRCFDTPQGRTFMSRYNIPQMYRATHASRGENPIAQDDRVVVVSRVAFKSRITGKVAQSPKADIFRFRDGKIVEFIEFFDTAAAAAATQSD